MGGRAVEGTGLENRRSRKATVGSNPTPSALLSMDKSSVQPNRSRASHGRPRRFLAREIS